MSSIRKLETALFGRALEPRSAGRWRKSRKRGVSPIIATILLVAITVVLAAVLYVLVAGLTHTSTSTPLSIQMSNPTPSNPASGIYWEAITLNPTSGLTTSMFTFGFQTISKTGISVGTAPTTTCKATATFSATTCTAPTGNWYTVLVYLSNTTVANVYSNGAWTGSTVSVTAGLQLVFVSGASYAGTGDLLSAIPASSQSVSGSVIF